MNMLSFSLVYLNLKGIEVPESSALFQHFSLGLKYRIESGKTGKSQEPGESGKGSHGEIVRGRLAEYAWSGNANFIFYERILLC